MTARKARIFVLHLSPKEGSSKMRRLRTPILLLTVLFTAAAGVALAQDQPATTTAPARLETELLKTIVFMTVEATTPGKPAKSVELHGTGFLVTVPDSRMPKDKAFAYLVTNRHIAQAIEQAQKAAANL